MKLYGKPWGGIWPQKIRGGFYQKNNYMLNKTVKMYKIRGYIVKNAKKGQKGIAKFLIMMYNKLVWGTLFVVQNA